jgi:FkbM family methyltransferase
MNPLKALTTPEYLFRPSQILRRLQRAFRPGGVKEFETVEMPWGSRLRVRPGEVIGSNICSYGLFDLIVAETIWRLLDEGETALDIGANLGQMSSLMQYRAGARGCVHAFEPHPEIFAELKHNFTNVAGPQRAAKMLLHNVALGEHPGRAWLDCGPHWNANRGVAKVVAQRDAKTEGAEVEVKKLDEVLASYPATSAGDARTQRQESGYVR